MSLNKTLDRLFDEIRREAKRNPDFADRLDAVLRLHESRRDVPDVVLEEVARETAASSPASGGSGEREARDDGGGAAPSVTHPVRDSTPVKDGGVTQAPSLNPMAVLKRDGEDALVTALEGQGLPALQALVAEHNLDPSGEATELDRDALAAHELALEKRRAARDEKQFDY